MNKDSANDTDILPPTDRAVLPLGKIDDDFMNSFEKHPEKDFGGYETPKSNSQPPWLIKDGENDDANEILDRADESLLETNIKIHQENSEEGKRPVSPPAEKKSRPLITFYDSNSLYIFKQETCFR